MSNDSLSPKQMDEAVEAAEADTQAAIIARFKNRHAASVERIASGNETMSVSYVEKRGADLTNPDGTQDSEECLYHDVLQAIASGAQNSRELAETALAVCAQRGQPQGRK